MVTGEFDMPVDADHRAICRFEDEGDGVFAVLCQRIEDAVGAGVLERGGRGDGEGVGVGSGNMGHGERGARAPGAEDRAAVVMQQRPAVTPAWSATQRVDMFGDHMGSYAPRRVMMIEYGRQMPGDDLVRELRAGARAAAVDEDTGPVNPRGEVLGAALTAAQMDGQNESGRGGGRGFFYWMSLRRRL